MPVPGTSASALAVSIATLSGFCVWRNCIDDDITMPLQPAQDSILTFSESAMQFNSHSWTTPHHFHTTSLLEKKFPIVPAGYFPSLDASRFGQIKSSPSTYVWLWSDHDYSRYQSPLGDGFAQITSSLSTDVEAVKSMAPRRGAVLDNIVNIQSSLGVGIEGINKGSPYSNPGIHASIDKVLSTLIVSVENLMQKHGPASDVDALGEEVTIVNSSRLMSCVGFTIIMTITDLILAFFFVALCRRLRSRKDSANCTPFSKITVIRPDLVKAPQPFCQDVVKPAPTRKTAGTRTRPTFAEVPAPLPHAGLEAIQQTRPAFWSTVRRPMFSQVAAPVDQEAPEFPGVAAVSTPAKRSAELSEGSTVTTLQARINTIVDSHVEHQKLITSSPAARCSDEELQAQINGIVGTHPHGTAEPSPEKPQVASQSDERLQSQINAIVSARAEVRKQCDQTPTKNSDDDLKAQINAIVGSHAEYRRKAEDYTLQLRVTTALSAAKERNTPSKPLSATKPDSQNYAVPSPAKSLTNDEVVEHANRVLSAAKDRNTPAKSSVPLVDWERYEEVEEVEPCQLNFTDGDYNNQVKDVEPKAETSTFDIKNIPSPTRNRAKRHSHVRSEDNSWPSWEEVQKPVAESSQVKTSPEVKSSEAPRPSQVKSSQVWVASSPEVKSSSRPKRDMFSSPLLGGAVQRMLQNSATPSKTPQSRNKAMSSRRAAAFEAWGVGNPDAAPSPSVSDFMPQLEAAGAENPDTAPSPSVSGFMFQ